MSEHNSSSLPDELISGYLDDVLPDQQRDEVEQWLERDENARRMLDDFRALRESLRDLPPPQIPPGLESAILKRIGISHSSEPAPVERVESRDHGADHRSGWKRGLVWAGLALTASVLIVLYQPRDSAGPTDVNVASNPAEEREAEPAPQPDESTEGLVRDEEADRATAEDETIDFFASENDNPLDEQPGDAQGRARGGVRNRPPVANQVERSTTRSAFPNITRNAPTTPGNLRDSANVDRNVRSMTPPQMRQQATDTTVDRSQASVTAEPSALSDVPPAETDGLSQQGTLSAEALATNKVPMIVVEVDPEQLARLKSEIQQRYQNAERFQTTTLAGELPAAPSASVQSKSADTESNDAAPATTRSLASGGTEVSWVVLSSSTAEVERLLQSVNLEHYVVGVADAGLDAEAAVAEDEATTDDRVISPRLRDVTRRFQLELTQNDLARGTRQDQANVALNDSQSPILLIATPAPKPAAEVQPAAEVPVR